MFNIKEKLERSLGKKRPENNFLKLLRPNTSLQPSIIGLDTTNQANFYVESHKEAKNALLEAERTKAIAVMARQQQHQRFC